MDAFDRTRSEFHLPPGRIYLDGNSLGLLSRPAEEALHALVDEWRTLAVDGWTAGTSPWFFLSEELAALTAPLFGATADEVTVTGGTTINLHQLLATLYEPARGGILMDALAFPSDVYAVQSHLRLRGLDPSDALVRVPAHGWCLNEDEIVRAMQEGVALAVLPAVVYTSGQLLDLPRLAAEAQRHGVVLGLDCSHSVGVVPHRLSEWGVDFAIWGSYKYLNGGPGAVGGLYLNRRHFGRLPGLAGWWGSDKERQFDMAHTFTPATGAGALQIGTPPILSLAPLRGALRTLGEVGIEQVRARSLELTAHLMDRVDADLSGMGFEVINPREPERRGGHVSLRHPEAIRVNRALKDAGVVGDYRPPDLLRLAPAPLYNNFEEVTEAVRRLRAIMVEQRFLGYPAGRGFVA